MGTCCMKGGSSGAFRSELKKSLLEPGMQEFPEDSQVVVVKVEGLHDLPIADTSTFFNSTNAFIKMSLLPSNIKGGTQSQTGSIKPYSLDPCWEPPEKMQFVVADMKSTKVLISLYHHIEGYPDTPKPLGDTVLKLGGLGLGQEASPKTVTLVEPHSGKKVKGVSKLSTMDLLISALPLGIARCVDEQAIFEFQRWNPTMPQNWGNSPYALEGGHLLPTDPGRWCTEDGRSYAQDLALLEKAVPPGWWVDDNWYTIATDADPDGWTYSLDFSSTYWYSTAASSSYLVRRRLWYRSIRTDSGTFKPAVKKSNFFNIASRAGGVKLSHTFSSSSSSSSTPSSSNPVAAPTNGSISMKSSSSSSSSFSSSSPNSRTSAPGGAGLEKRNSGSGRRQRMFT